MPQIDTRKRYRADCWCSAKEVCGVGDNDMEQIGALIAIVAINAIISYEEDAEKIVGAAEIRETFKISKVGTIAGCFVQDGVIQRNHNIRVIREGVVVYTGTLGSLKRFKDDAKEVKKGLECGLNVDRFNDIKVGDIIESYEEVEVKQTLDD